MLNLFESGSTAHTKEQALAEEIFNHFGKKIRYPMLMGIIKTQGEQAVRELFNETIKGEAKNPLALFMWKIGKNKTRFA